MQQKGWDRTSSKDSQLTPQENKRNPKDTRASVKVLDGALEFWNVKPTELGIVFFLSVFGAEWIRVFKLLANRMAMFLKIGDALVTYNWGH